MNNVRVFLVLLYSDQSGETCGTVLRPTRFSSLLSSDTSTMLAPSTSLILRHLTGGATGICCGTGSAAISLSPAAPALRLTLSLEGVQLYSRPFCSHRACTLRSRCCAAPSCCHRGDSTQSRNGTSSPGVWHGPTPLRPGVWGCVANCPIQLYVLGGHNILFSYSFCEAGERGDLEANRVSCLERSR